ncbi:hypothetical protein PJI16_03720 [Nitrospira sp. MA-1]|nr:hypothetical protein [Nitrospira sp. MA-1]
MAESLLHQAARRDRLKSHAVREYVHKKLHRGVAPELIADRPQYQNQLPTMCYEAIHQ